MGRIEGMFFISGSGITGFHTIWLILIVSLVAGILIWLYDRYRIKGLEKKQTEETDPQLSFYSDEHQNLQKTLRELEEKKQELEEKNKTIEYQSGVLKILEELKSRFFSTISHELRTPLTLIKGQTELLLMDRTGKTKEDFHQELKLIQGYTEHLSKQIDLLLHISKLETSKDEIEEKNFDLSVVVSLVRSMFVSLAKKKNISLDFEGVQESVFIKADEKKIELILINLVTNAILNTEENSSIEMRIQLSEKNGRQGIEIMVKGGNKSAPYAEGEAAFESYNNNESGKIGLVMSLSLVEKWVDMMKGTLSAATDENVRTIWLPVEMLEEPEAQKVSLPDKAKTENAIAVTESKEFKKYKQTFNDNKSTVLIADDNDRLLNMMRMMLMQDYNVLLAVDGEQALELARKELPDVIITDVMMPKVDGFEFCRNLKKDPSVAFIPVIMLTAKAGMENELKGLGEGGDAYIVKPFNFDILKQTVHNMLESRRKVWEKSKVELTKESIKSDLGTQSIIEKLNAYINEHLQNENLAISDIADALNVTQRHLQRKIKEHTGLTPKAYLTKRRLDVAMYLIQEGHGTVSEAAYGTGFSNLSSFARYFKREFDMLPSEVKKNG